MSEPTDYYRDSDARFLNDPVFNAAVTFLERLGREHGLTPGELKQIAFYAALRIEERRAAPMRLKPSGE